MLGPSLVRIAILDDYQNVALDVADWSPLKNRAEITDFNDYVAATAFNAVRCVVRDL